MEEQIRKSREDIKRVHKLGKIVSSFGDKLPLNPILRKEIHSLLEKIGGNQDVT